MKDPTVSIIVPVYNVEKYLARCIDSILPQSFSNFELLLIDDGSSDASGSICDEYAKRDNRIRIIHQNNTGSAKARQIGFANAFGEYMAFVDSDDWVDDNYLSSMLECAIQGNADIVISAYWRYQRNDRYIANQPTAMDCHTLQKDALNGCCHAGLWNKLIKKELLCRENMFATYNYYEDMYTYLSCLQYANNVVYCPIATYHYRINEASMTNKNNIDKRVKLFEECMLNLESIINRYGYQKDKEKMDAIYTRANYEKGRLLAFFRQYGEIRPYILKYFPESFQIIERNNGYNWGTYYAFQGNILPFYLYRIIHKIQGCINKILCKSF